MKASLVLILLLIFPGVSLSADVYYCTETASAGFQWEQGRYIGRGFEIYKFKMKFDGRSAVVKGDGKKYARTAQYECGKTY